jgi:hypothetical protein
VQLRFRDFEGREHVFLFDPQVETGG